MQKRWNRHYRNFTFPCLVSTFLHNTLSLTLYQQSRWVGSLLPSIQVLPVSLKPYQQSSWDSSLYHWHLTSNPGGSTPCITDTLSAIQLSDLPLSLTFYLQSGQDQTCIFLTPYQQSRWVCSLWCWTHSEWSPCPPHSQRLLMVSSPEIKLSSSVCFKY